MTTLDGNRKQPRTVSENNFRDLLEQEQEDILSVKKHPVSSEQLRRLEAGVNSFYQVFEHRSRCDREFDDFSGESQAQGRHCDFLF